MFGRKKAKDTQADQSTPTVQIKDTVISVVKGDITEFEAEAIVISTDTHLAADEGVSGALASKGGSQIAEELARYGSVRAGETVMTTAGSLKAQSVIHAAVGMLTGKTTEEIVRRSAYNAFHLAQEKEVASIAFPALGCEKGEYSYEHSSKIMAQELLRYLCRIEEPCLKEITFVLYSDDVYKVFEQNICRYLQHLKTRALDGPFVTVDGIIQYRDGIVMVKRSNPPSGWALPGGFLDHGESVEEAVVREVKEETSLDFFDFKQFKVYSAPGRDPRFATVSVVFTGRGRGALRAGSDAGECAVYNAGELPDDVAFDHRQIIEDYRKSLKG